MAKTKKEAEADEMTASHRLPEGYAFGVGVRLAGPGIAGDVVTQGGP